MLYIIIIPICGVICGVESWVDIELSGKTKIEWLKSLLKLPNGIPSHDTHLRVFAAQNPPEFETAAGVGSGDQSLDARSGDRH